MSLVSPQQILRDTFTATDANGHHHARWLQLILGCPAIVVAAAAVVVGKDTLAVGPLLTATSILTGLTFTMALRFWERSIDARRDPFMATDALRLNIVDRLRAHLIWTVFAGVMSTGVLLLVTIFALARIPTGVVALAAGLATYQVCLVGGGLIEFYRASYDLR